MIQYIKKHPLHLFLIPVLFVLKHFFAIVTPLEIAKDDSVLYQSLIVGASLILCSLFPVLIFLCLRLFKFTTIKSAIVASLACSVFYFTSEAFSVFIDPVFEGMIRIRWFLVVFFILLGLFSSMAYRSKRSFMMINEFMNVSAILLTIYVTGTLIYTYGKIRPKRMGYEGKPFELRDANKENVYFFLLDSYTSNKSLSEYFGFDNDRFVQALKSHGFQVSDESYSNYTQTVYSLAATFNPELSINLSPYFGEDMKGLIFNNSVVNSFYKNGYSIHNYSWLDMAYAPRYYTFSREFRPYFVNEILQNTVLRWWFESKDTYETHLKILKEVTQAAANQKDKGCFFYVHLLTPHTPFVMGPDGERRSGIQQSGLTRHQAYVDQVKGVNTLMIKTISEILKSDPNAAIIIQGDHGSRMLSGNLKEKEAHTVFLAFLCRQKNQMPPVNSHQIFKHLIGK